MWAKLMPLQHHREGAECQQGEAREVAPAQALAQDEDGERDGHEDAQLRGSAKSVRWGFG